MSIHPPKIETFDVPAGVNVDPKGFRRAVDVYRETEHGLYLSRPMPGHPTLAHLRSWLLPALGLRVTVFTWHPGHEKLQDFYLDVVDITVADRVWRTQDHYLDLVVHAGDRTEVLDVDEYCAALTAGLLDTDAAERALETSHATVAGLASHGHRLEDWLDTRGIRLTWT